MFLSRGPGRLLTREALTWKKAKLEQVWKPPIDAEFIHQDVEAGVVTMTDDSFVENVPTGLGGEGRDGVRTFYSTSFVNCLPDHMTAELRHRVVSDSAIVDELHHIYTY